MRFPALAALCLTVMLAGCRADAPGDAQQADWPRAKAPVMAVHYFGSHWAKNVLNAYRREEVDRDFQRFRDDGFNTVILLVPWGDIQPVYSPCCRNDARNIERLMYLVDRAEANGLQVMLRIGYAWTFHPDSPEVLARVGDLMNAPAARVAYLDFVALIADRVRGRHHVVMHFHSWEDQWLRAADDIEAADWQAFRQQLPGSEPSQAPSEPAGPDSEYAQWFHRYWDWLLTDRLQAPAQAFLPNLSLEVRIDKEPQWQIAADGQRTVSAWLGHEGMYRQPGNNPITLYWAPFWGAANQGEQLTAHDSLRLFEAMLREARDWSGDRPLFIGQFNVIDNTPGYENNAVIAPNELGRFLRDAVCPMKNHGVIGYGVWTTRDYGESPLYNPAFAFGLEGWSLNPANGIAAERLIAEPSGDNAAQLLAGDVLSQSIPSTRGRLPHRDQRPDQLCLRIENAAPVTLEVRAGAGAVLAWSLPANADRRECTVLDSHPDGARLDLSIAVADGSAMLRGIWLQDHVQTGGLYHEDGTPGPQHAAWRALNRQFIEHDLPQYCP